MPECSRCGERMAYNDETAKLTEFVCPVCHATLIDWKRSARLA